MSAPHINGCDNYNDNKKVVDSARPLIENSTDPFANNPGRSNSTGKVSAQGSLATFGNSGKHVGGIQGYHENGRRDQTTNDPLSTIGIAPSQAQYFVNTVPSNGPSDPGTLDRILLSNLRVSPPDLELNHSLKNNAWRVQFPETKDQDKLLRARHSSIDRVANSSSHSKASESEKASEFEKISSVNGTWQSAPRRSVAAGKDFSDSASLKVLPVVQESLLEEGGEERPPKKKQQTARILKSAEPRKPRKPQTKERKPYSYITRVKSDKYEANKSLREAAKEKKRLKDQATSTNTMEDYLQSESSVSLSKASLLQDTTQDATQNSTPVSEKENLSDSAGAEISPQCATGSSDTQPYSFEEVPRDESVGSQSNSDSSMTETFEPGEQYDESTEEGDSPVYSAAGSDAAEDEFLRDILEDEVFQGAAEDNSLQDDLENAPYQGYAEDEFFQDAIFAIDRANNAEDANYWYPDLCDPLHPQEMVDDEWTLGVWPYPFTCEMPSLYDTPLSREAYNRKVYLLHGLLGRNELPTGWNFGEPLWGQRWDGPFLGGN